MINVLTHGADSNSPVTALTADERGVLVMLDSHVVMTALFRREAAEDLFDLLDMFDRPRLITTHQEWSEELVERRYGPLLRSTRCTQMVYTGTTPLPIPDCGAQIRPMEARYIPLAAQHYSLGDEEYLTERMELGCLFGAFVGDRLAGFIGTHSETSLGMLEVLPEFRRRHIAAALESFMVNRRLEQGMYPYGQVIIGNEASMALQLSLGFTAAAEPVTWSAIRFRP